jgi:hypothetical protein
MRMQLAAFLLPCAAACDNMTWPVASCKVFKTDAVLLAVPGGLTRGCGRPSGAKPAVSQHTESSICLMCALSRLQCCRCEVAASRQHAVLARR